MRRELQKSPQPPPPAPPGPRTVAGRLCPTAPAGAQGPARMEPIHQPGPQMLTKTVLEAKAGAESRKGR